MSQGPTDPRPGDQPDERERYNEERRRRSPGAEETASESVMDREREITREAEPVRPVRDKSEEERIGEADDPGGRREWFLASRTGSDGKVIDQLYIRGSRQRHRVTYRPQREPGAPPA